MRALAAEKAAVAFVGGGTDLELGAPPARLDAVVRTRRLARVIEHAPSDQIVAVEAGLPLAALQRHLAPHGQRLALDPPLPERATIGGIVAANAFGPRRTRFGAVRDLVIGITVVRADGVVARGGGKVVKNVAGFDLPRLFCGSLGTLGLVAEVVFRLHPLPEASATVVLAGLSAPTALEVARSALDARLEPVAVVALAEGEGFRLALRFEGFAPGVADQLDRLVALPAARGAERLGGRGRGGALGAARRGAHGGVGARSRRRSRRRRSARRPRRCASSRRRSARPRRCSTRPSGSRPSPASSTRRPRRRSRSRRRARRSGPPAGRSSSPRRRRSSAPPPTCGGPRRRRSR